MGDTEVFMADLIGSYMVAKAEKELKASSGEEMTSAATPNNYFYFTSYLFLIIPFYA